MKSRKIRFFIGAFVNLTNAQNLNGLALAKTLSKEKYDVKIGSIYSGDLTCPRIEGVEYIRVERPAKLWYPLMLLRGLFWCDVAYLPKPEYWRWCKLLLRIFRKPAFKTVEGVFIGTNLSKALALSRTKANVASSMRYTGHTFSITRAMRDVNEKSIGLKTDPRILYLGVDSERWQIDRNFSGFTDVAMIGGNLFYKGIEDFFKLAKKFQQIRFHLIGSGLGLIDPVEEVKKRGLTNVICYGNLSHDKIKTVLERVQVHIFPSRSEGFPKVLLECAAAGVPSIVYDDYGASEWITSGVDGYVVKTVEEMIGVIQSFIDNPQKLASLSEKAQRLGQRFDWQVLIKDWEAVIDELAH